MSTGANGELGSISGTIYVPGPRAMFGVGPRVNGTADLAVYSSCISINGNDTFNVSIRPTKFPPSSTARWSGEPRAPGGVVWVVAAAAALAASIGVLGADVLWGVPLGRELAHGHLPHGVDFADALTSGWHDLPAGAELVVWALYRALGGDRGLVLGQVAAAAVAFGALAEGLRREAPAGGVLVASALVLAGSLPAVVVVGMASFSLALFPLLLLVVERDVRRPGRLIWLAVPLLALWGNLHGGVLVGWGLLACYLLLARARRGLGTALGVLAAATVALFANSALWHTPSYYRGVFDSEPARRASDLWKPLGTGGFDLLLLVAALALVALAVAGRARVALWEVLALAGLTAATVHVARTGVFFLFLAAYPAARGLRLQGPKPRLLATSAVGLTAGAVLGLALQSSGPGSKALAGRAAASGRPVLATSLLAGQVAAAGGRVWVSNPIDAFSRSDQRLYLDWLAGRREGAPAVRHAAFVLAASGSPAGRLAAHDPRLVLVAADGDAALYRVRRS